MTARTPLRAARTTARLFGWLLLAAIFFGVLTPIALLLRACGFDPLQRRTRGHQSFWLRYPQRQQDASRYERSF